MDQPEKQNAETVNTTVSTANEKFYEQKERAISLYSEYMPLLDRYDELKTKTRLSSDEQAELNSIITKITDNIPGVITKVGEYGQALDISSGKARERAAAEGTVGIYEPGSHQGRGE